MQLIIDSHWLFILGLSRTFGLALLTLFFATFISVLIGILATLGNRFLRYFTIAYVELFRDVPLLVSLFFIFFGAPFIGLSLDPFTATVITLSLWGGANGAEIVRAGIESLPEHQVRSARALGLKQWEIYRFIIIPQAFLPILPPLTGLFSLLIQSTSLAALIGVPEFFRMGQIIVERTTTGEGYSPAFSIYAIVLLGYYVISASLEQFARRLEARIEKKNERDTTTDTPIVFQKSEVGL
ncbi:MAG: amino acid ABC transporter permease [Granulosicoccus sp.]